MQILYPIPQPLLTDAAALWRAHFGVAGWPRRVRAGHGIVAVDGRGVLVGVIGLRDASGGFARSDAPLPQWLFRAAPATGDLVIDGLAVTDPRHGMGRALVAAARVLAARRGHPGLRAEVRDVNRSALAFYEAVGFRHQTSGPFGLPWWGQVHVLHLTA